MISSSPADAWNYIKRATFTAKGGDDDSLAPLQTLNQYLAYLVQGTQPVVPVGCNIANNFISVNWCLVLFRKHFPRSSLPRHQDMTSLQVLFSNHSHQLWRWTWPSFSTVPCKTTVFPQAGKWLKWEPSTLQTERKQNRSKQLFIHSFIHDIRLIKSLTCRKPYNKRKAHKK